MSINEAWFDLDKNELRYQKDNFDSIDACIQKNSSVKWLLGDQNQNQQIN